MWRYYIFLYNQINLHAMKNNQTINKPLTWNKLFFLVLFLPVFILSCSRDTDKVIETESHSVFSTESLNKIRKLYQHNLNLPVEFRNNNVTGKFSLFVKMNQGGKIEEIYTYDSNADQSVPHVCTINLFSFNKSLSGINPVIDNEKYKNTIKVLEDESIRVTRMLESIRLPEPEEKELTFAVDFNFYPSR